MNLESVSSPMIKTPSKSTGIKQFNFTLKRLNLTEAKSKLLKHPVPPKLDLR